MEMKIKVTESTAKDYFNIDITTKEARQFIMHLERSEVRWLIQSLDNAI